MTSNLIIFLACSNTGPSMKVSAGEVYMYPYEISVSVISLLVRSQPQTRVILR